MTTDPIPGNPEPQPEGPPDGHRLRAVSDQRRPSIAARQRAFRLLTLADLAITAAVVIAFELPPATAAAFVAATALVLIAGGARPPSLGRAPSDVALAAAGSTAAALLAALTVAAVEGVVGTALWAGLSIVAGVGFARYLNAHLTRANHPVRRRAAIVGTGPLGLELAAYLSEHHESGMDPVGFIDRRVRGDMPLPVLGLPDDIDTLVARHEIDMLIVAYGGFAESELVPVLRRCETLPVEVVVLPRFFELSMVQSEEELWGYPLARLQGSPDTRGSWRVKRLLDIVGSSILIVLFTPVMAAVAAAVKLSSPGPIIFRQPRVGHRDRVFTMYKFRSMLENDNPHTTWDIDDDLVTPVGKVIRATHLDELPQLFNVLKGDMSLVGPRPERTYFVDLLGEEMANYKHRHRVPGGITGWSQVNGLWGDTSIEARIRHDNRYIDSWSIGKDLLILVKTIPTMFKSHD